MSRKRHEVSAVRISDEEYQRLENKYDTVRNEFSACRRKLESKCEALLILSQELDQCRSERDQFKLMAEQLQERYQSMKKQMFGQPQNGPSNVKHYSSYSEAQSQNLAKLLHESSHNNKALQFELDDLKQKLHDAQGDIKLLREQIARQRVGTTDEGMNTRHFPAHEREELVQKLESYKDQYLQLERDLQTVLDEKEEHVTERDVYKTKYERLNQELNYILKGDENRIVDIDALVMENKYLQERMKQMEEEKTMAMAAVSKYKNLLERKKNKGVGKLGQSRGGGLVISQKQVQQVLESKDRMLATSQTMSDLQSLAGALLDTVNDKNLALSHQRKTNKILGLRVAELEKKIKTLEVAGLWSIPSTVSASLEKLRQECDDVKTLIPCHNSEAGESDILSASEVDKDSDLGSVTPLDSTVTSPEQSPSHTSAQHSHHLELEDLDLLPTKEVSSPRSFTGVHINNVPRDASISSTAFVIPGATDRITDADVMAEDGGLLTETIQSHAQHTNINGLTEMDANSVHVYNADKISENGDSENSHDNDVFLPDTHTNADMDSFYNENDAKHEADINDGVDTEGEKIGLLMQSVAQKMCNISHSQTDSHDNYSDGEEEAVQTRGRKGVVVTEVSPDSPSVNRPLLVDQEDSESTHVNDDSPHDVEC